MLRRLNINTALLICFAFVFRLLFVNISTIAAQSSPPHKSAVKSYASIVIKRAKHFDVATTLLSAQYACTEFCEEEDDAEKIKHARFSKYLDWLVVHPIKNIFKTIYGAYQSYCYCQTHRYLKLQVFRI